MNTRRFQRTKEDFVCQNCGQAVMGSGYTNHCPGCLWSRHVDVQPGDRAEGCGGMMEPMAIEKESGNYRLLHRCTSCAFEKWNKIAKEDDFDALLVLVAQQRMG